MPEALHDSERGLEELVEELLPASHAALAGRPRAACSFHCPWPSILASPSDRIWRPSIATPAAGRTASSTWAR